MPWTPTLRALTYSVKVLPSLNDGAWSPSTLPSRLVPAVSPGPAETPLVAWSMDEGQMVVWRRALSGRFRQVASANPGTRLRSSRFAASDRRFERRSLPTVVLSTLTYQEKVAPTSSSEFLRTKAQSLVGGSVYA